MLLRCWCRWPIVFSSGCVCGGLVGVFGGFAVLFAFNLTFFCLKKASFWVPIEGMIGACYWCGFVLFLHCWCG